MPAIYSKTWVYTSRGIELRCYLSAQTVAELSKQTKPVAGEMGRVSGIFPNPKELKLGSNTHGIYLYASFDIGSGDVEARRSALKSLGWTEGK